MIQNIIFDLGGVLFTNGTKEFVQELSDRYELRVDDVKKVIDGDIGSDYRENKITSDEFWELVFSKLDLKESQANLEKDWIDGYDVIPETKDMLVDLKKKYKVYYLSDNVKERVEALNEKFGFVEWFDGGIFSHEVGVRKPNIEIYQALLDKYSLIANKSIFIDDKQKCLDPAQKLGLKVLLFENAEKLIYDLEKLLS